MATPYTDKTLENLPKEGKKMLLLYVLAFPLTVLKLLRKLSIQGKESF